MVPLPTLGEKTAFIDKRVIETPSPRSLLTELAVGSEWLSLRLSTRFIHSKAPSGDGHTVIVYPGFGHGNPTARPLRRFLRQCGYNPIRCDMRKNVGLTLSIAKQLRQQVELAFRRTKQPVSLIGWSLGGFYARIIANQVPKCVRQVITLGSPYNAIDTVEVAPETREWLSGLSPLSKAELHAYQDLLQVSPPCHTTSVYGALDGLLSRECCIERRSNKAENVVTISTHSAMLLNPNVYALLADRLHQPEDDWRHFKANVTRTLWNFPTRDDGRISW